MIFLTCLTDVRRLFPVVRDSVLLWVRAIVREPKVFLLDEPLSNLDAKLRAADENRAYQASQDVLEQHLYTLLTTKSRL